MPVDSERRCCRCATYLNEDGTCVNQHCPSNRDTLPAPVKTAPEQRARTHEPPTDCCDFADENNITSVESPQAKNRYPERTISGTRARVGPNAANADDDESRTLKGAG